MPQPLVRRCPLVAAILSVAGGVRTDAPAARAGTGYYTTDTMSLDAGAKIGLAAHGIR